LVKWSVGLVLAGVLAVGFDSLAYWQCNNFQPMRVGPWRLHLDAWLSYRDAPVETMRNDAHEYHRFLWFAAHRYRPPESARRTP